MADQYWGAEVMAKAREHVQKKNGATPNYMIMGDRIEWQDTGGDGAFLWDAQSWYGGDLNKLWIKTEGEYSLADSEIEDAEVQALWSRAISSFWDVQAGVRYDLAPKGRTHAVLGVQGLAPYWFEVDAAAFLSTDGDLSASVEAEYELRFSQRITLQPRAEIGFSASDIPELEIGSGITNVATGIRLRYEIKREFAPYIGMEWQTSLGETADFVRAKGGDPDDIVAVIGLRAWY
jgi:copper resistance protein B